MRDIEENEDSEIYWGGKNVMLEYSSCIERTATLRLTIYESYIFSLHCKLCVTLGLCAFVNVLL